MFIVSAKEPAKHKMNAVSRDLESKRSKNFLWAQPWWALLVGHWTLPSHCRLELDKIHGSSHSRAENNLKNGLSCKFSAKKFFGYFYHGCVPY